MRVISIFLIFLIRAYQVIVSPLLGGGKCRFYPTCSEYAAEALRTYGAAAGLWLAAERLVKCGPWHEGGFDPLPEPEEIAKRKWLGRLCTKSEETSKG
ncbi:MAG: membrane protein insertion efficiency factor YidD [Synergistes sp.]|nr:membrane protein insertion efficiency factor YidD [Synergistes sp.]